MLGELQTLQNDMRAAAEIEEYIEASKIKLKRDEAHRVTLHALVEAETHIDTLNLTQSSNVSQQRGQGSRVKHEQLLLDDLSLSTIRRFEEDDPSIAMTMTGRSFQLQMDDRPIISRQDSSNQSSEEQPQYGDVFAKDEPSTQGDDKKENGKHPLYGVPNYDDLPQPDEMFQQNEAGLILSINSSNSITTSSDAISKVESILGSYRTRCFFSKNWSLREAAILKFSLMLPSIVDKVKRDKEQENNLWDTLTRNICIILEKSLDDKIVQVFLTGLIALDDCVNEFEELHLTQKEAISLLSNIVFNLVDKLSSGNQKLVEGAETALMSLALFDAIGPIYIASIIMKRTSSKDSKGKLLCQRFQLLREIVSEFGHDGPNGEKIIDFVKTHGFGHKDTEVREAAKELTTEIFLRDGRSVISMLDGLSERQLKDYKVAFANANHARNTKETRISDDYEKIVSNPKISSSTGNIASSPGVIETKLTAPTPRGRGRGRGRIMHIE